MASNCERLVAEINERKQKSQKKAKPKLRQQREYFGQYGKVLKVSISKTGSGVIQHSSNNICCIACFGTTKYCHAWLRNVNVGNQSRESCVDDSTRNSTVLPAAASWPMRVYASLSPVPNISGSGTFSNIKPDAYTENRQIDILSDMTSALVTCGNHLPETPALKGMDFVAPTNIKSSINFRAKLSHTSSSDDGNINTDVDVQDLSSICTLVHTKNEESVPAVPNSSAPTHMPRSGNVKFTNNVANGEKYTTLENPSSFNFSKEFDNLLNSHTFVCSKLSASHLLQTSESQIKSIGCSEYGEFFDPAILKFEKRVMVTGFNKPDFGMMTSVPHQSGFDHDARLELLVQQSLCAHQSLPSQDNSRNRISQPDDSYSWSPMLLEQSPPVYNPSSFPQSRTQQLRSAHMLNGHGCSWKEDMGFNNLRLQDLLKNEEVIFNKLTPSYEDLKCQVSGSSNLYNRGFAMRVADCGLFFYTRTQTELEIEGIGGYGRTICQG
ncbi:hypothetical protein DITRI_Ditri06bG0065700 [Diplodiscus trichospermus]